jgi:hypothetical protein
MRICEGGFGQVIWSAPSEQNAPAAFLLARDQSVSENCSMISVAVVLGLKIVSCSVILEKVTRSLVHPSPGGEDAASRRPASRV